MKYFLTLFLLILVIGTGFSNIYLWSKFSDFKSDKSTQIGFTDIINNKNSENIHFIEAGIQYKNCVGYCKAEIKVMAENIEYKKYYENSTKGINGKIIITKHEISPEDWNYIISNVSMEDIKYKPPYYGCPECENLDTEWIIINNGKFSKKITFENSTTIFGLEELVEYLRNLRESL